ncbi:hypothetical protein YT1_2484 [Rhodococcus ruber]|nr:hypothetical protein YT1_2484 [Rhodococcus ruber]
MLHGVLMSVRTCSSQSWCPRSGAYRYAEFPSFRTPTS